MTRTSRTAPATPSKPTAPPNAIAAPRRSQNAHLGGKNADNEEITTLENDPSVLGDDNMIDPSQLRTDGQLKPPAVDYDDLVENPGPPVKRYVVVKGGRVQTSMNGLRTQLNEGKELDALNYDIELLKRQGVKLEELPLKTG